MNLYPIKTTFKKSDLILTHYDLQNSNWQVKFLIKIPCDFGSIFYASAPFFEPTATTCLRGLQRLCWQNQYCPTKLKKVMSQRWMNYYISHSTALANNLTATSYLSHLMIYFFFITSVFKRGIWFGFISESISLQVLLFHFNFLQQYVFRWFNSMQLRMRRSSWCAPIYFFLDIWFPLARGLGLTEW